jgi:hypothetical protein
MNDTIAIEVAISTDNSLTKELAMSNTQNTDPKAASQTKQSPLAPDGKSKLPTDLPDFPVTNGGDPGPTHGPMPK